MDDSRYDSLDDRLVDDEYFDDALDDDGSDVDLVPCPECGAEVYEDAVRCPLCGTYITHSTSAWEGKSLAWVLLGLLGIVATMVVLML